MILDPDCPARRSPQAVLGDEAGLEAGRLAPSLCHPLPILGVNARLPGAGLVQEPLGCLPEQLLDLRADVRKQPRALWGRPVGHARNLLDQRAQPPLRLTQLGRPLGHAPLELLGRVAQATGRLAKATEGQLERRQQLAERPPGRQALRAGHCSGEFVEEHLVDRHQVENSQAVGQ